MLGRGGGPRCGRRRGRRDGGGGGAQVLDGAVSLVVGVQPIEPTSRGVGLTKGNALAGADALPGGFASDMKKPRFLAVCEGGAGGGTRTPTPFRATDFESIASAISPRRRTPNGSRIPETAP